MRSLLRTLFAAAVFAASVTSAAAQQLSPAALDLMVPHAPRPAHALGRTFLVHELHVTNFGSAPVRIAGIIATADGTDHVIGRWDPEALRGMVLRSRGGGDALVIESGERAAFAIWITLGRDASVPAALRHEVVASGSNGSSGLRIASAPIAVANLAPTEVGLPVDGGRWAAIRGPSNSSGHRRSLVALDGSVRVPQRFAVDFVRLGDDGRFFEGDGTRNEQWYGYGEPVLAASAGRVARVIDGIPDGAPRSAAGESFSRESVAGNVVVVATREGASAVYAHLQPGSIAVKEGDEVQRGAHLGRIGSSGHSLAPHLHFHLGDAPDVLAGEGLPFVIGEFELLGLIESVPGMLRGSAWQSSPGRPTRSVKKEMPLENMVLAAPAEVTLAPGDKR